MKRDEIRDLALCELVQRSFRLMRENNPEADKVLEEHRKVTERMDACMSRHGGETRQLYDDFCRGVSQANSMEVEHAYVQGARDCVCLLRFLGVI